MATPDLLTTTLLEATTGLFSFPLLDQDNVGVPLVVLDTLTLTYYDMDSGAIVNNRLSQNALNANDVTVVTVPGPPLVTTVTFAIQPEDTVILNEAHALEQRIMQFRWTWDGGTKVNAYEAMFGIENTRYVP